MHTKLIVSALNQLNNIQTENSFAGLEDVNKLTYSSEVWLVEVW